MSNKRKIQTRPVQFSGKSVLILGLGYFKLPNTIDALEDWQQACRSAMRGSENTLVDSITDAMRDAITTGEGAFDDADIDGVIIIHLPDGGNIVAHVRDIARGTGVTEAAAWEAIDNGVTVGLLTPCADDDSDNGCSDGGYRMNGSAADSLGLVLTVS